MNNRGLAVAAVMIPATFGGGIVLSFALMIGSTAGGAAGAAGALLAQQAASVAASTQAQAQCAPNVGPVPTINPGAVKGGQWSASQKANAAAIVEQVKAESTIAAGDKMRAAIIALATAMQESTLTNIAYGDKAGPDSRGLFQQRAPWGPLADRMDPHKAAHMFLTGGQGGQRGLTGVSGWQHMPIWQAAQSVQVSAFPTAYAKWEAKATALATTLMGASGAPGPIAGPPTSPDPCGGTGGTPGTVAPASAEVEKMLSFAKSLLGTPYHWGGTTYPPGVDCSGLLVFSWKHAGHPLRIRTAAQMWNASTELQPGTEKRGDEVYSEFVGGSNPGHVMIVWDPAAGTVIEAPHTGDVVKFLHYKHLPGIKFARFRPTAWLR